jgi:hypothetical protein
VDHCVFFLKLLLKLFIYLFIGKEFLAKFNPKKEEKLVKFTLEKKKKIPKNFKKVAKFLQKN